MREKVREQLKELEKAYGEAMPQAPPGRKA